MYDYFLRGQKVLFIGPVFYNYHKEIISELQHVGASVDFYAEKPMYKFFIMNYLFVFFRKHFANKYLSTILKNIESCYDYIFIIRGEIITEEFLNELKHRHPESKFIMYQWDSIRNNLYDNLLKYFDKTFTFDMIDAKKLNIQYLPLFYISKYNNIKLKQNRKYDLVFYGSYHGDRLEIIKAVSNECNKLNLNKKFYLYIPKTILIKKILTLQIKLSDLQYLSTNPVCDDYIIDLYSNTKAVLDIENINQNGMTIRTFEVLGSGLKLVTTNKNILNDKIYDSQDIYFLDRSAINLGLFFFKQIPLKNQKYINYSLKNWIQNVFS